MDKNFLGPETGTWLSMALSIVVGFLFRTILPRRGEWRNKKGA